MIVFRYQFESEPAIASVSSFDVETELKAAAVVTVRTFVFVVTPKLVSHIHLNEKYSK